MEKIILISVVTLSLLITSCVNLNYQIKSKFDKFDNTQTNYMLYNWLGNNESGEKFSFDIAEVEKKNETNYFISLTYFGSDWFFIEQGESLVLLIDGKRVGLTGNGSIGNREVMMAGLVSEYAYYSIGKKLIKRIVNSKSVEIKIIGKYSTTRFLTPENYSRIKSFYNKYIKQL